MVNLDSIRAVLYLAAGLLVGLIVHEYAHAWMAVRLGDQTPRVTGRLSLNLKPHVEPFGTYLLPAITLLPILFGRYAFGSWIFLPFAYAKPQDVNVWTLRRQERDRTLIALAGPGANLVLATVLGLVFRATGRNGEIALAVAFALVANVIMAVMQLLPIPPLDGSRLILRFLSPRAREVYANLDQYGALFLLVIFFVFSGPIFALVKIIGNGICALVAGGGCL